MLCVCRALGLSWLDEQELRVLQTASARHIFWGVLELERASASPEGLGAHPEGLSQKCSAGFENLHFSFFNIILLKYS